MANKVEVIVSAKDQASAAFAGVAKQLVILTTALVGVKKAFDLTIKSAADFEQQLLNVSTLVDTSVVDMKEMQSGIIALSREVNQLPIELVRGMYQTISAGAKPGKEAFDILRASAKLATAGLTSTEAAVRAISGTINAYGLEAADATRISDVFFKTVEKGVITVEELAGNVGKSIPFAARLGVSIEELSAAIATLTKGAITADVATTAVKNTFASFIKSADKFKDVGIDIVDTIGEKGLAGALKEIEKITAGDPIKTQELVPDIRSLLAVLSLGGKQFDEFSSILRGNIKAAGATEVAFKKQVAGLKEQFKKLKIEVRATGIQIGTAMLPVLKQITEATTQTIIDLKAIYKGLGIFIEDVASFIRVQWNRALVDPEFMQKALDNWNAFAIQLGSAISALWGEVFKIIKNAASFLFAPLFEAAIFVWDKIKKSAAVLWQGIELSFVQGLDATFALMEKFGADFSKERQVLSNEINMLSGTFDDLKKDLTDVPFETETLLRTQEILADDLNNALLGAKDAAIELGAALTFETLETSIFKLFSTIQEENKKLREALKKTMKEVKDGATSTAASATASFEKWFGVAKKEFTLMQTLVQDTWSTFRDGFAQAVADSVDTAETWADRMDNIFKEVQKAMIKRLITEGFDRVAAKMFNVGSQLGGKGGSGGGTGAGGKALGFGASVASIVGLGGLGTDPGITGGFLGGGAPGAGLGSIFSFKRAGGQQPAPTAGGNTFNIHMFENADPIEILMRTPMGTLVNLVEERLIPAINIAGNNGVTITTRIKRNQ
jgi:TP901 family phage tail tape measure protein